MVTFTPQQERIGGKHPGPVKQAIPIKKSPGTRGFFIAARDAKDQRMPGIMPFMPRISLDRPPLAKDFIIFWVCSN